MLKIIGRKTSSNVMKVLWACAELGLDFERKDLGGPFGGNDSPEYQALNPNGLVPTIIENDFVLWESNSIVRYLAHEHSQGALWPTNAKTRARAERWMDWQLSVLSPVMVPVFRGLIRTPEAERDMAAIGKARDGLASAMAILDRYLGDTEFVAGSDFTLGDIPVGIATFRWFALPIKREDFPNLKRWYGVLTERTGYQEHIMIPME